MPWISMHSTLASGVEKEATGGRKQTKPATSSAEEAEDRATAKDLASNSNSSDSTRVVVAKQRK